MPEKGAYLVERCVPPPLHKNCDAEELTRGLQNLKIKNDDTVKKNAVQHKPSGRRAVFSPKDHLQRQTERSGALAGRTKTTSTMDNRTDLTKELLTKDPKTTQPTAADVEPDSDSAKSDKENDTLIDRGPVPRTKYVPRTQASQPYTYGDRMQTIQNASRNSCSMVVSPSIIPHYPTGQYQESQFGYYYNPSPLTYNRDWDSANSSSPASGYGGQAGYNLGGLNEDPLAHWPGPHGGIKDSRKELPEALSDFILKYSRRYSHSETASSIDRSPESVGGSDTGEDCEIRPRCDSSDSNSDSASSACNSPMSATAPLSASPAAPNASNTHLKLVKKNSDGEECDGRLKMLLPKPANRGSAAKDRLKRMFSDVEMLEAWAWAVKCVQMCPGAIYFRDPDGDSLLHICVWHKDLAKTYALVEHMCKSDQSACRYKPFDLPNRNNETPLFLAVEKRLEEVVAYLVECGANPNMITRRHDAESPLHYAASRGMVEIVNALCAHSITDKNLINAMGLTALMCAVKNHGVIEEESQCLVNNKPTIRALLKHGADPKISDATNGKTVLHYSVERMDPELVEIFRINVDKSEMKLLVNKASYDMETPLQMLVRMANSPRPAGGNMGRAEAEEELRRKMMSTLLECGAQMVEMSPYGQRHSFDSGYENSPGSSTDGSGM